MNVGEKRAARPSADETRAAPGRLSLALPDVPVWLLSIKRGGGDQEEQEKGGGGGGNVHRHSAKNVHIPSGFSWKEWGRKMGTPSPPFFPPPLEGMILLPRKSV